MAVDWSQFKPVQPKQPAQPEPAAIDWSQFTPVAQPAAPAPVQPAAIPAGGPVMRASPEPTMLGELGRAFETATGASDTLGLPLIQRLQNAGGIVRDAVLPDSLQRGWIGGQRDMAQTLPSVPTIYGPAADQAAREVQAASLARDAEAYGPSLEDAAALRALSEAPSVGAWASQVAETPGVIGDVILESMGRQAVPLIVNAVNPVAGVGASGASSYNTERLAAIDEAMMKAGVDITDPIAVSEFKRTNPDIIAAAEERGQTRGAVIGAADALTAGLAGRFFRASGLGNAVKRTAADAVLGVGGGAGGEAAAQVVADGGITSLGDILTEGVAEGPTTVIEGITNTMGANREQAQRPSIRENTTEFIRGGVADLRGAPAAPATQPSPQAQPVATPTPAPAVQAGPSLPGQPPGAATTPPPIPPAAAPAVEPPPIPAAEPSAVQQRVPGPAFLSGFMSALRGDEDASSLYQREPSWQAAKQAFDEGRIRNEQDLAAFFGAPASAPQPAAQPAPPAAPVAQQPAPAAPVEPAAPAPVAQAAPVVNPPETPDGSFSQAKQPEPQPAPAPAPPAQPAAEPDPGAELEARARALEPRVRALSDDEVKAALSAIGEKPRANRDPREQLLAQHPDDIDEALASFNPAAPQAATEPEDDGMAPDWQKIEAKAQRTGWWSKASSVAESGRVEAAGRRVVWRKAIYAGNDKPQIEVFDPDTGRIMDYGSDPAKAAKAIDEDIAYYAKSDFDLSMALRNVRREALAGVEAAPAAKKQVTRKGRPMRPDTLMDDAGDMSDADVDAELGEEAPQQNQRGRGTTPEVQRVSFTNRRSWFEQAFADAGVNPDEATLWPIERQFATLARLVKDKFGIDVKKTEVLQGRIAVDQLLDLYRNGQFMAHVMGLPSKALGLHGKLTLVLRKGVQYLGAYYPGGGRVEGIAVPPGTVVLPKRSNSFAHEWMHALDHYLMQLFDGESEITLLSQKVKKEGFDGEAGSAKEAFIRVMDNLFFDQTSMAARILSLELQLEKENLSASSRKKIEEQIATLRRGNATSKNVDRTSYRTRSAEFGNADYWANPQEMLARAFEAYTAFKVEAAGGSTETIAKGDMAYLSDAEDRLAMTFPKGEERLRIFAAFDRLFEAMAKEQLIADGVAASAPGNMQVFDVYQWDRTPALKEEHRGLTGAVRQTIEEVRNDHRQQQRQRERPSNPKPLSQQISDVLRYRLFAERSVFRILERRYKKSAAVRQLADLLVNAPGEGRVVGRTYEEAVEQIIKIAFNRLGNIAERYGIDKLDDAGRQMLRDLLISENVQGAPENLQKAAVELRKFLDMEWYRNQQAGMDIGYARNGYLPRLLDMPKVMTDKIGFIRQAAEVYKVIFDKEFGADAAEVMSRGDNYSGVAAFLKQAKLAGLDIKPAVKLLRSLRKLNAQLRTSDDPDILQGKIAQREDELGALIDELFDDTRNAYGRRRAEHWHTSIMTTSVMDFDAMSPDSTYTKNRKLPPQADKLMEDFYINDPIEAIQHYMMQSARRTEYARRFGAKGEKLQSMFDQMTKEGVSPEDQEYVKGMVNRLTGRSADGAPIADTRFLSFLQSIGIMTLLPRAVLSSLGEPTAAAIRSGDLTDAIRPYVNLTKSAVGTAEAKDWAQIARAIGAVSNSFADTLVANRFGGTFDSTVKNDVMMSRFFQRTMLQGLTNAQRTAIMPLAHQFLLSKAEDIKARGVDPRVAEQDRAFLRELGIADPDAFADWLLQDQAMPTLEQLYDSNGIETKHGAEWMTAINRYLDQVIQNPKSYDRPGAANTPVGRLIYGILSFSMAFYANVWKRQGVIIKSIAQRRGVAPAVAYAGLQLAPSLFALFLVQTVVSTIREAIFNPDRWEEWEREGTLEENLLRLGVTRSFAFGLLDPVIQGFTGLKYQRDLSNVMIGAVPGFFVQSIQGFLQPAVQNTDATNNAEYKAAQSAYQLAASPAIVYALSMAPGGRLVNPIYGLGMMFGTSPAVRDAFADAVVGEKDSRVQARERAARQEAAGTGRATGRGDTGRSTGRDDTGR